MYRTFGDAGYSPAKGKVRIYNNRWYMVTMQNVEHDGLTDYIGLAAGTYRELVPGKEARERRDAHLNHCNAVQEYRGPVYGLHRNERGRRREPVYYPSEEAAESAGQTWADTELAQCRTRLLREIERDRRAAAKTREEFAAGFRAGSFEQMRELHTQWADAAQRSLDALGADSFTYTIERMR